MTSYLFDDTYEMTAEEEGEWTDHELDWRSLIECAEEYWARGGLVE